MLAGSPDTAPVNLTSGITYSCDVVFYEIGKGFYYAESPEGMQETFRSYVTRGGLRHRPQRRGRPAACRTPSGSRATSRSSATPTRTAAGRVADNCNIAIGQGDMLVTCLQMADAYCSIANRGPIWRPPRAEGRPLQGGGGPLSPSTASRQLANVEEEQSLPRRSSSAACGGSSTRSPRRRPTTWTNMSIQVAGKTGTAEQTASDTNVCWFGCYAPSGRPQVRRRRQRRRWRLGVDDRHARRA